MMKSPTCCFGACKYVVIFTLIPLICCRTRKRRCITGMVGLGLVLFVIGASALFVWYEILVSNDVDYDLNEVEVTKREVFISPKRLSEMMKSETGVTVIDARTNYHPAAERLKAGYGDSIEGSRKTQWKDFTINGERGELQSIDFIERKFRELGVSNDVPVVIYGGWKEEWGEEGRIFWQLDWLNHTRAYILYGGIFGWNEAGYTGRGRDGPGDFTARPVSHRYTSGTAIFSDLENEKDVFIVDARAPHEYEGATPYGSAKGGHIPTAVSYDWRRVFNEDGSGNLKSVNQLKKELKALGYKGKKQDVVVYCTSGIRAGFLYSVFVWMGHEKVANYPGSWYVWSRHDELPVEL